MRFKYITKLGTAILLAVLIFSCDKQTQNSPITNNGKFKIKITITPPFQAGTNGLSVQGFNQIKVATGVSFDWYGTQETKNLNEFYTNEFPVKSGYQYCGFSIFNGYDRICRNIKLEGFQNGKIIQTFNFNQLCP